MMHLSPYSLINYIDSPENMYENSEHLFVLQSSVFFKTQLLKIILFTTFFAHMIENSYHTSEEHKSYYVMFISSI